MWAYDGFADLTFASGEVTDPQRNLPRAIIFGTLAIIAIYLAANAAYLYVNPIDRLKDSRLISADTMGAHLRAGRRLVRRRRGDDLHLRLADGQHAGFAAHLLRDGRRQAVLQADRRACIRSGTRRTWPSRWRCVLGVAMVMTQTFEQLTDTFVLAMWPFYALSVAAIYRLRKSQPHLQRPYKVIGYPFVPAVFIAAAIYLVINALDHGSEVDVDHVRGRAGRDCRCITCGSGVAE